MAIGYKKRKEKSSSSERYTERKLLAKRIAYMYLQTNLANRENLSRRMSLCGTVIHFGRPKDATDDTHDKVINGLYCGNRLCPICSYRRSNILMRQINDIVAQPEVQGLQRVFITLTVPNCKAYELSDMVERMLLAYKKMIACPTNKFNKSFPGWIRSLEVTYDKKTDTYHPHIHVLAWVCPEYFDKPVLKGKPGRGRKAVSRFFTNDSLAALWLKFLNKVRRQTTNKVVTTMKELIGKENPMTLDVTVVKRKVVKGDLYEPICPHTKDGNLIVKIEAVKGDSNKQIAEIAKYTVKGIQASDNPEVLETLTKALYKQRCVTFGGLIYKIAHRLNVEEVENDDGEEEDKNNKTYEDTMYDKCTTGEYVLVVKHWCSRLGGYTEKIIPPSGVGKARSELLEGKVDLYRKVESKGGKPGGKADGLGSPSGHAVYNRRISL